MAKVPISFRADSVLEQIIQNLAENRSISSSEMVNIIVTENIADYEQLDELERKLAEQRKKQREENMHSSLAERKMKKATYIPYVRSQVQKLKMNGATDQEVMDVLESMKPIAERRDKLEEFKGYMEDFKKGSVPENIENDSEVTYRG